MSAVHVITVAKWRH